MKQFLINFANLVKVKTIITFAVIAIFAVLSFRGEIPADKVSDIAMIVIAFYFGTQHEKAGAA